MRALSLLSIAVSGALTALSMITAPSAALAQVPTAIKSTTDQITQYSPQHRALTLERLCEMMNEGNFEVSKKSAVTCTKHGAVVEFTGSVVGRENVSVYGNATDKTVIEYFGDNEIHYYQNDLKQVFRLEFIAINTGVRKTPSGTEVLGFYRLDGRMINDTKSLRVGYFSDLQ